MKCEICGKEIQQKMPWIRTGKNSGVCSDKCFHFKFWNDYYTSMCNDSEHKYIIINGHAYHIGNEDDITKGFSGRHWRLQFFDGYICETTSLWHMGQVPQDWREKIVNNGKQI